MLSWTKDSLLATLSSSLYGRWRKPEEHARRFGNTELLQPLAARGASKMCGIPCFQCPLAGTGGRTLISHIRASRDMKNIRICQSNRTTGSYCKFDHPASTYSSSGKSKSSNK